MRAAAAASATPATGWPTLIAARDYPLGLRREALRTPRPSSRTAARRILELATDGKLPDDLKTEATTRPEHPPRPQRPRRGRRRSCRCPRRPAGRPLPPIGELVRREGDADHGRDGLLPGRHQRLRRLPPRPGAGPVGRPRPLDDRHQVRQGRAAPLDPEPERGDRLQLPLAWSSRLTDGRVAHRPAGRGDARPPGAQDGRGPAGHDPARRRSRTARPATSR